MMEQGLLHLYWGDGKGKTTAAMGLALRALGSGKRVVIVQFLKGGQSGEIPLLAQLGAKIFRGKGGQKFVFQMNEAEKAAARAVQNENLTAALAEPADLLILDEAGSAWELDMVDKDLLRRAVLERPAAQECVLTAHKAPQWMLDAADYSTEMKCRRHPYQKGIKARKGIEDYTCPENRSFQRPSGRFCVYCFAMISRLAASRPRASAALRMSATA